MSWTAIVATGSRNWRRIRHARACFQVIRTVTERRISAVTVAASRLGGAGDYGQIADEPGHAGLALGFITST